MHARMVWLITWERVKIVKAIQKIGNKSDKVSTGSAVRYLYVNYTDTLYPIVYLLCEMFDEQFVCLRGSLASLLIALLTVVFVLLGVVGEDEGHGRR